VPGVTRFALVDTCVQNATGAPVTINVTVNPTTGVITRTSTGAPPCPAAGTVVGRFVANPALISTVGQVPPAAPVAVPCVSIPSFTGQYGPVFSVLSSGTTRIIGFARLNFTRINVCPAPGTPFTATIARAASIVAASNATASLVGGLPLPATAQPAEVSDLLQRHAAVTYGPVLVPVLAR
jgi:hypothetical protein